MFTHIVYNPFCLLSFDCVLVYAAYIIILVQTAYTKYPYK